MKAKLCIVVLEDYENNLVQQENKNANEVDEMTPMWWDIMTSWEGRHI
jgi:hypothetical protein